MARVSSSSERVLDDRGNRMKQNGLLKFLFIMMAATERNWDQVTVTRLGQTTRREVLLPHKFRLFQSSNQSGMMRRNRLIVC